MVLSKSTLFFKRKLSGLLDGQLEGFQGSNCGVGVDKSFGKDIVDSYYKACLYAGINLSGINDEVMPSQWEFQVGPSVGISTEDKVWITRYILEVYPSVSSETLKIEECLLFVFGCVTPNCVGELFEFRKWKVKQAEKLHKNSVAASIIFSVTLAFFNLCCLQARGHCSHEQDGPIPLF